VAAALWVNLVLERVKVKEFGAFYAQWAHGGMIRSADGYMNSQKAMYRMWEQKRIMVLS